MTVESLDFSITGLIYDGLGNPPKAGTIGIRDGLIVSIFPILSSGDTPVIADRHIDADGLVIAPGFIDVHTHSDVSLFIDGRGQSKVFQGVTTEVTGNCSFSAFPIVESKKQQQSDFLVGIGDDQIDLQLILHHLLVMALYELQVWGSRKVHQHLMI